MIERSAMQKSLAQHLAIGADGFGARRLQIGQILAFFVVADVAILVPYMEEISGHVLATALLS